jgi:dTMP kinase
MDELFHARVRNGFRTLAAAEPDRCVMICAESPLATVGAAVRAAIAERFGLRPSAWPPEAGS